MTHQPKPVLTMIFLLLSLVSLPAVSQDEETSEEVVQEDSGFTDYISMDPAFVTHVGTADNKPTYLKAAVSLRARSASTRPALETHMPRLRHELVMLFGEQTDIERLTSMEGQQALREEAKQRINAVLEEQQTGESIAGVLFTEFVVQK
ncbi:flagellar basal body-associated FliL family protein [Marinobacter sp. SS8-8]|uniref:flagellar basal body-associated FliL family protein n=1 Tax=Marinobacter sp. SS8-8 TaxID=3050452 RepID=UPI000C53298C|nr:flagellar basal body-associated FliL family protein [Marinobacter sp. SS8-8]MAZ05584.1 flagellar basal body protein FliL [Halomonas sp.]